MHVLISTVNTLAPMTQFIGAKTLSHSTLTYTVQYKFTPGNKKTVPTFEGKTIFFLISNTFYNCIEHY